MPKGDCMKKNAIIIGASSGIGKSLAEVLSQNSYRLGLAARRLPLLHEIRDSLPGDVFIQQMDVSTSNDAEKQFECLIDQMGGVDLVIISAGTALLNPDLDSQLEMQTIDTNVTGFVVIANAAFRHFQKRGKGHLVGISSIAALRGNAFAPAYNASKAFISNYLEGLRVKAFKNQLDIRITDARPGFVDTPLARGDKMFWVSSPEKAAVQIFHAIRAGKSCVYITKRWRLIAWLMKWMPMNLYKRF